MKSRAPQLTKPRTTNRRPQLSASAAAAIAAAAAAASGSGAGSAAANDAMRRRFGRLRGVTRPPTNAKATLDLALLGIIAEIPGATGYDIAKVFDLSMSHFWHVHTSQIYPTLARMEQLGTIKGRQVVQRGRPSKRRYTIAESGERILVEWLESPFEGFMIKHPPLLRTRFLSNLGGDGARAILEEERTSWANQLRVYLDIEKKYFSDKQGYHNVNAMFSMFTLRRGIDWMVENIRWCDWAIGEIEKNRKLFPAQSMKEQLPPIVPFDEWQESQRAQSSARRARAKARAAAGAAPASTTPAAPNAESPSRAAAVAAAQAGAKSARP